MGLMDILNGMQNGPRGPRDASPAGDSGGMSKITMAMLALLAWRTFNGKGRLADMLGHGQNTPAGGSVRPPEHTGSLQTDNTGGLLGGLGGLLGGAGGAGGLGGLLQGGLGGLLGGAAAGSVLSGGLGDLINKLQQNGHGDTANSWVGTGENKQIAPEDLRTALGDDTVNSLSQQAGLSDVELLSGLSQNLPHVVDQLTPHGRLPTEEEAQRYV